MNRLLITNGAFTTLLLSAILSGKIAKVPPSKITNYLLFYFKTLPPKKIPTQLAFAKFFFNYEKDFNLLNFKKRFTFNLNPLKTLLPPIQEIYIPINSTTQRWYDLLKKLYPSAEFIFYEEGLMSYIKGIFHKKLKNILQKHTAYYLFYNKKITKLFPKKFLPISKEHLLQNIKNYQTHHIILKKDYPKSYKYALVLPQYYFQKQSHKHKKLEELYIYNIKLLIKNGYHILFKDHPKSKYSYYPLVTAACGAEHFTLLNEIDNLPVEMIGNLINISLVFSVYSTSLFTLPYLFNIPPLTSYKMLQQRMNTFSLYPALLADFTQNHIPDLESGTIRYNILLYLYRKMLTFIHKNF